MALPALFLRMPSYGMENVIGFLRSPSRSVSVPQNAERPEEARLSPGERGHSWRRGW